MKINNLSDYISNGKMNNYFFFALVLLLCLSFSRDNGPFLARLQPVSANSGFRMDGYWVWGGSVIKVGNTYHMFASRWPKNNKFPDDYFFNSEIVRATSDSPTGPYTFQEVVIGERDSSFWDSNMAHNPTIHKIGDKYVLFYIGSDFTTLRKGSDKLLRRIGYATSSNIEGPWTRSDKPVIDEESNNPALLVESDESVKLIYRDENLKIKIAVAQDFKGPFKIANSNVWGESRLEDFYMFKNKGKYHFICEDNEGKVTGHLRWGADFISNDGINNWHPNNPVAVYNHDISLDNDSVIHCLRRERPQLLIEDNSITYLLNGVYDGKNSWTQPVPLIPRIKLK